jgi:hypothetical protein
MLAMKFAPKDSARDASTSAGRFVVAEVTVVVLAGNSRVRDASARTWANLGVCGHRLAQESSNRHPGRWYRRRDRERRPQAAEQPRSFSLSHGAAQAVVFACKMSLDVPKQDKVKDHLGEFGKDTTKTQCMAGTTYMSFL